MEIARDGGACAAIGCAAPLVFVAAGIAHWGFGETPRAASAVLAGMVLLLAVLAGLGRWRVSLEGRQVVEWWGLARPWRRRVVPLSSFRAVRVGVLPTGEGEAYEVLLMPAGAERPPTWKTSVTGSTCSWREGRPFQLHLFPTHEEARRRAEEIALVTGLPLEDAGPLSR